MFALYIFLCIFVLNNKQIEIMKSMQVSKKEKRFYEVFTERGHNQKALINFILGARKSPMYGSIFHINGLCEKLKSELSKIYHGKLDFEIDGKSARSFISETWEL